MAKLMLDMVPNILGLIVGGLIDRITFLMPTMSYIFDAIAAKNGNVLVVEYIALVFGATF